MGEEVVGGAGLVRRLLAGDGGRAEVASGFGGAIGCMQVARERRGKDVFRFLKGQNCGGLRGRLAHPLFQLHKGTKARRWRGTWPSLALELTPVFILFFYSKIPESERVRAGKSLASQPV